MGTVPGCLQPLSSGNHLSDPGRGQGPAACRCLARGMQGGVSDQRLGQWNFAFVTAAAVASGFGPRAESPSWARHRSAAAASAGAVTGARPSEPGAGF